MPDRPLLDRAQIARLAQGVPQTMAGLEKIVGSVAGMPSTIEEANALAGQALATAHAALSMLVVLAEALERLECAAAGAPLVEQDDHAPRAHLGTMSSQNHDAVEITGGAIDGAPIGQTSAATGKFTAVIASGLIISTLPPGEPPLIITSTDKVDNLYVDRAALADHAEAADHATTADSLTSPTDFPPAATDAASAQTLVNALRAAAIEKGL